MLSFVRPSCQIAILSTDQDIIPVRKAIDAHAQDFMMNDELLQPTLKSFALAHYTPLGNAWCFSVCVCSSITVRRC
jgi:hypothetical protein